MGQDHRRPRAFHVWRAKPGHLLGPVSRNLGATRSLSLLGFVGLLVLAGCRGPFSLTASLRIWQARMTGKMEITEGGAPGSGTGVDVSDDLDLGPDNTVELGLDLRLNLHRLKIRYLPLAFSGHDVVGAPFVFHGETYPAGTRTSTEVDLTLLSGMYDYPIVRWDTGELRAGGGVYFYDFHARIQGRTPDGTLLDEDRGFSRNMPAVALSFENRFGMWHVNGSALGAFVRNDRNIFDIEGSVGTRIWERVQIDAGYRWIRIDLNETTNDLDLAVQGPFLELSFRF